MAAATVVGMLGGFIDFVGWFFAIRRQRSASCQESSQSGFILVMMSICLLTLTSLAGFAVDLGNWYWTTEKLQRAADSASLAAAPYLPGNPVGAQKAALQELSKNGFASDDTFSDSLHVGERLKGPDRFTPHAFIAPDPNAPTHIRVEIGVVVHNYFASLLGYNEQALMRGAIATYKAPIPMGNPGQVLGAQPPSPQGDLPQLQLNGDYWLNIAGGATDKVYGDQFTAGKCSPVTSECSGGNNTAYPYGTDTGRSHRFSVHIPANVHSPVDVQVFDGAFVDVGDYCQSNSKLIEEAGQLSAIATQDNMTASLYASGPSSPYCTGDAAEEQGNNGATLPQLTLTAHAPSKAKNTLGATISTKTFPALRMDASIANAIASSSTSGGNPTVRATFRRWYTFVTLHPETYGPGDYVIEATTPSNAIGANRFSLRAGIAEADGAWDDQANAGSRISISAIGHETVFTNFKSGDTSFYFAKLTSASAGRTLDVELFGIGDSPYPVTLKLEAPMGASGSIQNGFGECEQVGPGSMDQMHSSCGIYNAWSGGGSNTYQGKNVHLKVKVPDDYVCDDDGVDNGKCWMALRFLAETATPPTAQLPSADTSTWQVLDDGVPVRLCPEDGRCSQG